MDVDAVEVRIVDEFVPRVFHAMTPCHAHAKHRTSLSGPGCVPARTGAKLIDEPSESQDFNDPAGRGLATRT